MTASWLIQMGWEEVYVLEGGLENNDLETGPEQKKVLGIEEVNPENLSAEQLNQIIKNENPLILDLADSLEFREGHLPGAKRASRSGMAKYLENQNRHSHVILSSSDGALASLTAEEVQSNLIEKSWFWREVLRPGKRRVTSWNRGTILMQENCLMMCGTNPTRKPTRLRIP